MARYSGNILRLAAPQDPQIAPGAPDAAHDQPSGPDGVPAYHAETISVSPETGIDYAGLRLDDGVPQAIVAGTPGLGWNAPETASVPVGSGSTPNGNAPGWTHGNPHNAATDTSYARNRGATPLPANHDGNDSGPYSRVNPMVGVEGSSFLEREAEFPRETWAEPSGQGVDKFIGGTNSYRANNPEGDQFAEGRGEGRVHYGFESEYFVHQQMFIDKPNQFYERRTPPITATDPLVGGRYSSTPILGQLAANPWLSELGQSVSPEGYGVAVDGVM
jgi:hypothetical protein